MSKNNNYYKEKNYQDINDYIDNLNMKLNPTYLLLQITKYIKNKNYDQNMDIYNFLVEQNQNLIKILNQVTEQITKDPDLNFINQLNNDPTIASIIDIYCVKNNIYLDLDRFTLERETSYLTNENITHPTSYRTYLNQINKSILTKEQERTLFLSMRSGNLETRKKAKQELIERNLLYVVKIAKSYCHNNNEQQLLDLIQEGNIGLMEAIDNFDVTKEYKFSTYANFWIRKYIWNCYINQANLIRLPMNICLSDKNYQKKSTLNPQNKDSKPTYPKQIVISNYFDNDEHNYYDVIEDSRPLTEELVIKQIMQKEVQEYLAKSNLEPKYLNVLIKRFGLNQTKIQTLKEIGDSEGVSQEAIRIRENIALSELRKTPGIESFAHYMDNTHQALCYLRENKKNKRGRPRKS